MLLAIMYHKVGDGKHANHLDRLDAHLNFIKDNYPVVLPGDPLEKRKISVCLTFDDATFDFYHSVFPLLKKYQLKALLGVPAGYIVDSTTLDPQKRLETPYTLVMQDEFYKTKVPFCTWKELDEMVRTGFVEVASHAYLHCNLTFGFVNLEKEVIESKKVIESHLPQKVSSFIYPFGKVNYAIQDYVSKHYLYTFRIGSAMNFSWGNAKKPVCRVIGDNLLSATEIFKPKKILSYVWKRLLI